MIRHAIMLLVLVGTTACGESSTGKSESAVAPSPADGSASAKATAPSGYHAGQNLVVLREAKCTEEGPKAGEPWDMKKGAYVGWIADVGPNLRVDTGLGLTCLIARDAIGPA